MNVNEIISKINKIAFMLSVMGYSYIRPVHSMNGCKRRNAEQRKCCRILISIRICFWK
jgi:hypothetical protein